MTGLRKLLTAILATVLVGVLGAAGPAQASPTTTIGAIGVKGPLYSTASAVPPSWTNLGGVLINAPAVITTSGVTHYVATGGNGILYHRTGSTPWHRLAPDNFRCAYVSGIAWNQQVHIGCTGTNQALYEMTFAGDAQTPFVGSYTRIGGTIYGPAAPFITGTGSGVGWAVIGGRYDSDGLAYNVYLWIGGWIRWQTWCDSPPGMSRTANLWVLACGWQEPGKAPSVHVETSNDDYKSYGNDSQEGKTWGNPAVAGDTRYAAVVVPVNETGDQMEIIVQGTTGAVYTRNVSFNNSPGWWTNLGGVVKYGVGASSLFEFVSPPALRTQGLDVPSKPASPANTYRRA